MRCEKSGTHIKRIRRDSSTHGVPNNPAKTTSFPIITTSAIVRLSRRFALLANFSVGVTNIIVHIPNPLKNCAKNWPTHQQNSLRQSCPSFILDARYQWIFLFANPLSRVGWQCADGIRSSTTETYDKLPRIVDNNNFSGSTMTTLHETKTSTANMHVNESRRRSVRMGVIMCEWIVTFVQFEWHFVWIRMWLFLDGMCERLWPT